MRSGSASARGEHWRRHISTRASSRESSTWGSVPNRRSTESSEGGLHQPLMAADHDVLLAQPNRRAGKVDEPLLVFEQRIRGDLPLLTTARGEEILDAIPPEFGNAVVLTGLGSARRGKRLVGIGVAGVRLDIAADAKN